MRFWICLFVLLLISLGDASAGLDRYATRQSAGVFLTIEGRVYSLYVDFGAREFEEGGKTTVSLTLTTDLDLFVEGHPLEAGRHEWTLQVAPDAPWSLGEPATTKRGKEQPRRHLLAMRESSIESRWLAATLTPDPNGRDVLLALRFGAREGVMRFVLQDDAERPDPGSVELDLVELRNLRDRLREVAGVLEAGRARHHLWSVYLTELGDAMIEHTKAGWVRWLRLDREGVKLALETCGRVGADRRAVDEIRRSIGGGILGQVFDRIEPVIPRALAEENAWEFQVRAEVARESFEESEPIAALTPGDDPQKTAEEVLLLEERLIEVAGRAGEGVGAFQEMLLGAKRKAGCLLPKIEPGETLRGTEGLWTQKVRIVASGSGPSLVSLLRELEDGRIPVRILLETFGPGDYGPELALQVQFLGYTPLSERNPRLLGALRDLGESPRFAERRKIYLRGLSRGAGVPFDPPGWDRDPFSPPSENR